MKAFEPLISIIMPAYNCEGFIEKSINSIINQTYTNFELLICDDASTDNTYHLCVKYSCRNIKVFKNNINQGYLKTCNYLYTKTNGLFITFQDADDYSLENRLEILVSEFRKNNSLALVGSNYFRTINGKISYSDYPIFKNDIIDFIKKEKIIPFCGASVMIKKSVISTELYNPFFVNLGFEDYYLILSIILNHEIKNVSNALYHYTYNKDSITRNFYKDAKKYVINNVIIERFINSNRLKIDKINIDGLNSEIHDKAILIKKSTLIKSKISNLIANSDFRGIANLFSLEKYTVSLIFINPKFFFRLLKVLIKPLFNGIKKNNIKHFSV